MRCSQRGQHKPDPSTRTKSTRCGAATSISDPRRRPAGRVRSRRARRSFVPGSVRESRRGTAHDCASAGLGLARRSTAGAAGAHRQIDNRASIRRRRLHRRGPDASQIGHRRCCGRTPCGPRRAHRAQHHHLRRRRLHRPRRTSRGRGSEDSPLVADRAPTRLRAGGAPSVSGLIAPARHLVGSGLRTRACRWERR